MKIGRTFDELIGILMRVNGRTEEEAAASIERLCDAGLFAKEADGLYYKTDLGVAFENSNAEALNRERMRPEVQRELKGLH